MTDPAELVAALRDAGAEVFDPLGFRFVESLVARAEILGGGARDRLLERARLRIEALDAALRDARRTAEQELGALGAEGASIAPALREALARGEVSQVRREIRRERSDRSRERVQVPWLSRLRVAAAARGAHLPEEVTRDLEGDGDDSVDRGAHTRAVAAGGALSRALFRASAESARAMLAVARAADDVPDGAGPYNAQVLAARALAVMAELSPVYVRVAVAMADDLAALEALLAPDAEAAKRRTKAGKSSASPRRRRPAQA